MAAGRSSRSRWISLIPTCMSAVPRSTGPPCPAGRHAARPARRCASRRRDDPASAGCPPARSRSPRMSAMWPARRSPAIAFGVRRVRRRQVPARPEREPQQSPRRRPGRGGRPSGASSSAWRACRTVPAQIAVSQGQGGPVHRDRRRAGGGTRSSSTTTISADGGLSAADGYLWPRPATARRPAARPRRRRARRRDSSAPAKPTLSTGLARTTSSGSAFSQPRTVGLLPAPAHGRDGQLDQVRRALEVPGGQRVADRLGRLAVALVPGARPPVQVGHVAGLLVREVRLQDVGEEVVVAIPLAVVVERDHEQVGPLQRLQHGLARRPGR